MSKTRHDPALPRTALTDQFLGRHLQKRFACQRIFDHECSLDPSASDISRLSFCLRHFIELPAMNFLWCPDFMFAPFAVIQLVIATWDTPQMKNERQRLHLLSDAARNRHRIVGMRLGQIEHLDAFVLRLVAVGHPDLIVSKLLSQLRNKSCFERGDMGGIFQRDFRLSLDLWKAKLRSRLCPLFHITRFTGECKRSPLTSLPVYG